MDNFVGNGIMKTNDRTENSETPELMSLKYAYIIYLTHVRKHCTYYIQMHRPTYIRMYAIENSGIK
jgi:hypothetical protein